MAAKKKQTNDGMVDKAARDIAARYRRVLAPSPGETRGAYISAFKDVVSESGLVDRYSNAVLMKAAGIVGGLQYDASTRAKQKVGKAIKRGIV